MNSKTVLTLVFLSCVLLGNFAHSSPQPPQLEEIYGYKIDAVGVSFQVYSGGCTDKRSFQLVRQGKYDARLALYRIVSDHCLALLPGGVMIRYTYGELGLRRGSFLQVVNPLRRFSSP